ncbi:unnamed protein product [Linum trigynum]
MEEAADYEVVGKESLTSGDEAKVTQQPPPVAAEIAAVIGSAVVEEEDPDAGDKEEQHQFLATPATFTPIETSTQVVGAKFTASLGEKLLSAESEKMMTSARLEAGGTPGWRGSSLSPRGRKADDVGRTLYSPRRRKKKKQKWKPKIGDRFNRQREAEHRRLFAMTKAWVDSWQSRRPGKQQSATAHVVSSIDWEKELTVSGVASGSIFHRLTIYSTPEKELKKRYVGVDRRREVETEREMTVVVGEASRTVEAKKGSSPRKKKDGAGRGDGCPPEQRFEMSELREETPPGRGATTETGGELGETESWTRVAGSSLSLHRLRNPSPPEEVMAMEGKTKLAKEWSTKEMSAIEEEGSIFLSFVNPRQEAATFGPSQQSGPSWVASSWAESTATGGGSGPRRPGTRADFC